MHHSHARPTPALHQQRGASVLAVLAAVVVVVVGLVVYKERERSAAKAERQRLELVQRQEAERAQREREAALQREREALQAQAHKAEQEKRDLLASSLKQFDDVALRFDDASRIASSTGRISLAQPVSVLQSIHREAAQLSEPPCLAVGKGELVDGMKETVDAYIAFMQNRDKIGDILAAAHFEKAQKSLDRYRAARAACPAP